MAGSRAKQAPEVSADGRGLRIAVLFSGFNRSVVGGLVRGARQRLASLGVLAKDTFECEVPGAFELPLASRIAAESGRFDAVVALGAVIRGDTDHYEHVARAATEGLLRATLETSVPIAFGVLTVRDAAQAELRAAPGPANKGGEAAAAAVAQFRALGRILDAPIRRGRGKR